MLIPVGFLSDVAQVKENLNTLFAAGGGDGPEAATAALKTACDLVGVLAYTRTGGTTPQRWRS